MSPSDHHSEYLSQAVAALTPNGRARVDELLEQLMAAAAGREWLVRFAQDRRVEADAGAVAASDEPDPAEMLGEAEMDRLTAGFMTIRDTEQLDDVGNWANAVLALLEDVRNDQGRPGLGT